jgi:leucyl/phenylalanyl-tRNA--protein transferase
MIDCQVYSSHLISLGAEEISRSLFCKKLKQWCSLDRWGLPMGRG